MALPHAGGDRRLQHRRQNQVGAETLRRGFHLRAAGDFGDIQVMPQFFQFDLRALGQSIVLGGQEQDPHSPLSLKCAPRT